ncbi:hypothetical protein G4Y79_03220 [Phototrophicus methaneseepsis]|uniref:SGNH hydrolase-type esterase domain-containing protein n=1 Tax=Phototrophicus methaneseepsis TaxID=2710758 RepID=A0A7S8EAI4_9CHLR|nr:GDSL-type esterase/lipase family protein [Phototrophicus methaneseepsis]QPC83407.1 hypothetical protein G4Y79_03220 [Phototrophicus methaneseepsis]
MSLATALSALAAGFFIVGLLFIVLAVQGRWRRVRTIARSLLVSYVTIAVLLLIAEGVLRYSYADSGWSFTLAHQNWQARYWHPNSSGFRDREWSPEDWEDKTTLVILGDSFASGWGVNDPADRFGNVLAALLGDAYAVINHAKPGQSTPQQLTTLESTPPEEPDIVLLQYFLNDIELASASVSRFWDAEFPDPRTLPWIIQESHLVNFIYWRLYPLTTTINTTFEGSYWDWQYETYDNATIWEIHRQQIEALIDYVESIDAELYVVIFPNMEDPVGSIPYVDRVKFVFEDRGYGPDHIMTLYDEVAAWDPAEVVASPRDAHPSAAFHRYVGELLYQRFFANEG